MNDERITKLEAEKEELLAEIVRLTEKRLRPDDKKLILQLIDFAIDEADLHDFDADDLIALRERLK